MSTTSNAGQPIGDDEFTLALVGVLCWPVLGGVLYWAWGQGTGWLVKHQVLVAAKANPLLEIPGMHGAGLDGARLLIAAGILVGLVGCTIFGIRKAVMARRAVVQ